MLHAICQCPPGPTLIRLLALPLRLVRTTASPSFSEANTQYACFSCSVESRTLVNSWHWSNLASQWMRIGDAASLGHASAASSLIDAEQQRRHEYDGSWASAVSLHRFTCWVLVSGARRSSREQRPPVPAVLHNLSGFCSPACTPPSVLQR
ncbi:hypothetical protein JOL62DRAFT_572315 [Phyllosticta paracitricarpa]|uniref:Secreted protein n=1 Tax=Phyllosticta paracitricarpa TaxID=2016321 RepID=A0ABR1NC18_9PEZI